MIHLDFMKEKLLRTKISFRKILINLFQSHETFLGRQETIPASSLWLNKAEQWMGKMKLDGGEGPCMPWGAWAQALSWQKPAAPTHACSEPQTAVLGMCPRRQLSKVWTRRYKPLLKARVLNLSLGELCTEIHWKPRKWHPFGTHGRRFNTIYVI